MTRATLAQFGRRVPKLLSLAVVTQATDLLTYFAMDKAREANPFVAAVPEGAIILKGMLIVMLVAVWRWRTGLTDVTLAWASVAGVIGTVSNL